MPMWTSGRASSVAIAALFAGCIEEFPCQGDSECQEHFGAGTVCAEHQPGLGKRCYVGATAVNTQPRSCGAAEVIIAKQPKASANYGSTLAASDGNTLAVGAFNYAGTGGRGYVEVVSVAQPSAPVQVQPFAQLSDQNVGYGLSLAGGRLLVNGQTSIYRFNQSGGTFSAVTSLAVPANGGTGADFDRGALLTSGFAFAESYAVVSGMTRYFVNQLNDDGSLSSCHTLSSAIEDFGYGLAADDSWLAIGARGGATGQNSQVCMYQYRQVSCQQDVTCTPLTRSRSASDGFGAAVALSGGLLVVGAPHQSATTVQPFFTYELVSGAWQEGVQPDPFTPNAAGDWGAAVALAGDLLVVGAPMAGQGRIYQWRNRQWTLLQELSPPVGSNAQGVVFTGASFGAAVAVTGDVVAVGAPEAAVSGQANAGAVLVYRCPAQ